MKWSNQFSETAEKNQMLNNGDTIKNNKYIMKSILKQSVSLSFHINNKCLGKITQEHFLVMGQ